jgi:hypothetical protein
MSHSHPDVVMFALVCVLGMIKVLFCSYQDSLEVSFYVWSMKGKAYSLLVVAIQWFMDLQLSNVDFELDLSLTTILMMALSLLS